MDIKQQFLLKSYNTFQISSKADYFVDIADPKQISDLRKSKTLSSLNKFILGGGSNTLITRDIKGVVIHSSITGIEILSQDQASVTLEIGSGEDWHQLVTYAVQNNWGGLENLAYIPGTVGGAPVQNLAAYGQNFSDVFESLEAVELQTGKLIKFSKTACRFGYRQSIFKTKSHQLFITRVRIKLSTSPQLETSYYSIGRRYDSLEKELNTNFTKPYSIKDVYHAVINIRHKKLPDVKKVPSVGSFFINPIVSREKYVKLQKTIRDLQCYPVDQLSYLSMESPELTKASYVKIPVGKLLDELGWRGRQIGNVKVFDQWASIITHNGQASGKEILEFTQLIKKDVKKNFNITLQTEVTII